MDPVLNGVARSMEIVILIGAFLMALGAGIKRVYKMAKNVDSLVDSVRENNAEAKRVAQRLELAIEEIHHTQHKVIAIKKEVLPNGGSSLRDAVNRIESRVAVLEAWNQAGNANRE